MVFSEGKIDQPISVGEPEGRKDRAISQKINELLAQLEEIDYQLFSMSQSPGLKDDDYSPAAQTANRFMTARTQSEERQQLISERERLHKELAVLKTEQKNIDTDEYLVD